MMASSTNALLIIDMLPKEIICNDPSMLEEAQVCSQFLSIPIHNMPSKDQYLNFEDGQISIISLAKKQSLSYRHSFKTHAIQRRIQTQDQHLLKAFNDKHKAINSILDITAGWCRDSFILAQNNYQVTAIEQSDLIYYLSNHSLIGYLAHNYLTLELHHANALHYLQKLSSLPDAIYLDPMFPSHKHQAKNKKEIQLLQSITQNVEMESLFALSLKKAKQRIVVKRPLHSEFLNNLKPDFQFKGKTIRFDIYQCF